MKRWFTSFGANLAVSCLLFAMGAFSTLYLFLSSFALPYAPVILGVCLAAGALLIVLSEVLQGRTRRRVLLVLAALWLAAGLLIWRRLWDGAQVFTGYFTPALSRVVNVSFLEPVVPDAAQEWNCALLCIFGLVPYTGLLVWLVVRRRTGLGALAAAGPVLGFVYTLKGTPDRWLLVMQLVFFLTLLIQPRAVKKEKMKQTAGKAGDIRVTLMGMALSAVVLSLLLTAVPREEFEASPRTYAIRDDIIGAAMNLESLRLFQGLSGFTSGSPLTSSNGTVDLNSAGRIRFADRDVMRVYTDTPQNLYLRGYSASVYTGSQWLQEDPGAYKAYGVDIDPNTYMNAVAADYYGAVQPITVRVEFLQRSSNFLFTAYQLAETDGAGTWSGDAYLDGDGVSDYTFTTYGGLDLEALIAGEQKADMTGYLEGSDQNAVQGVLEYGGYALAYTSTANGPDFSESGAPESVIEEAYQYLDSAYEPQEILAMFYPQDNLDASYMAYITDAYTQLPDGLRETLLRWWQDASDAAWADEGDDGALADNVPFWDWVETAHQVSELVRNTGTYSTEPGTQPRNWDFVEYFLQEGQTGYCIHYASATAAVLRALGIPARYVEGYVVSAASFTTEGWAPVPARKAHAWAEIWVPNFGWVPVESTPGGTAVSQGITQAAADPEETPGEDGTQEAEEAETELPEELIPESDDTDIAGALPETEETQGRVIPVAVWYAALGFAALVLVILIVRTGSRMYRKRRFYGTDRNRSLLYAYQHLQLLERLGAAVPEQAGALAQKAKFSQHRISREELSQMQRMVEETEEAFRASVSAGKRPLLWLLGI